MKKLILVFCVLCLAPASVLAQRNVTLRLNASSITALGVSGSFFEIRGAVDGSAPFTLPDGNVIDWGENSTLHPVHEGGDYYSITFQIPNDKPLNFKFWSQAAADAGLNGGWESDTNAGSADGLILASGNNGLIPVGTDDVVATLHYFNASGGGKAYDWRPYTPEAGKVAVRFRVYMCTVEGKTDGFIQNQSEVSVAGDDFAGAGPMGWSGFDQAPLPAEASNGTGADIFSGTYFYDPSLVGSVQAHKFVMRNPGGATQYEEGNVPASNRQFTVPASDTTIAMVYYGDTAAAGSSCGEVPVQQLVSFSVDLSPLEAIGMFNRTRGDTLQVRGGFNGWDCGPDEDDCRLERIPGTVIYQLATPLTAFNGTSQSYKFFLDYNDETFKAAFGGQLPPQGWEEPSTTTGANRVFTFDGSGTNELDLSFFNDIESQNIIPAGTTVDVKFKVDMTAALTNAVQPFVPASGDSVFVEMNGDAIWAFTQGWPRDANGVDFKNVNRNLVLTDPDADNIYEGSFTVTGPTYGVLQYKFAYGQGSAIFVEPGGSTSTQGRRRTRYIQQERDFLQGGIFVWPSEFELNGGVAEVFNPIEGALPSEENTVSIEVVNAEIPDGFSLSDNYPNPFNPTTSFEYTVFTNSVVQVQIFDVAGRLVETLLNEVQAPNTYRVTFDANGLSSGTYLYRVQVGNNVLSKKMTLLK